MVNLIDTHFHLDYYKNHKEIYNEINKLKQYTLCVTNLPEIYESCIDLYKETNYIKFAIGYNPQMINEYKFNRQSFLKNIDKTKYVGEVGLDFSKKYIAYKEEQVKIFDFICKVAAKKNKIITIHCKASEKETIEILRKNRVKYAIIHWYTGPINLIDEFIKLGYYFSINFNMLSSKKGISIINRIPKNRLLIESDGPFGKYNKKAIQPHDIKIVYNKFESNFQMLNLDRIVYENFKLLLKSNINE